MRKSYTAKQVILYDGDFDMKFYDVEELITAGQGSCSCLRHVELEILILEGILPDDYYESKDDSTYLSEKEVSKLIKEHEILIFVEV